MKLLLLIGIVFGYSSCLKTRSDVSGYKSPLYSKKQSDNQIEPKSKEPLPTEAPLDEKDETIRQLNGRIETLENQITKLSKDKNEQSKVDENKMQLLQESLLKMENQLAKLEQEAQQKALLKQQEQEKEKQMAEAAAREKEKEKQVANHKGGQSKNHSNDKLDTGKKSSNKESAFEQAQVHFQNKDFKNAILEYQKFVDQNPKSKLAPEAKYKIGLCFESLKLKDEAETFYEEVAAQYPKTEFGKKAKAKLNLKNK